jgi:hypothetical protein
MSENPISSGTISPDAFLDWEAEIRSADHHPLTTTALRRFRQVVRSSAKVWLTGLGRRLRAVRASDGCRLHFQFQYQDRWLTCFVVQAHHSDGLFTLKGPCPERKRIPVSRSVMHTFDILWASWRRWPESEGLGRLAVTVYLHAWPPAQVAKYAASADKAVATLQKHAARPAAHGPRAGAQARGDAPRKPVPRAPRKASGKTKATRSRTASPKSRSAGAKRRK